MKIDVSDLFDELFAIAAIARRSFERDCAGDLDQDAWRVFCDQLSDAFFLPLVARRVVCLTHDESISPASLKRHIITPYRFGPDGTGFNMWYDRPRFFDDPAQPCAFEACFEYEGRVTPGHKLNRPQHSLRVHIGPTPATEYPTGAAPYDPALPCSYYRRTNIQAMFSGRQAKLYETRGEWIVREVTLGDSLTRSARPRPYWLDVSSCEPISVELFAEMWNMADN